ncbi:MAG: hypothetical protein AAF797_08155 [Planctomycetota bacterium]
MTHARSFSAIVLAAVLIIFAHPAAAEQRPQVVIGPPAVGPVPANAEDNPNATTVEIRSDILIPQPANPNADPDQPANAAQPQADPDTLAKFAEALSIRPNNLSFSSNISFDEHGQPRHQSANGSINFTVDYNATLQPIAYDNFRLTRIVTDDGTDIPIHQDPRQRHSNQFGRNQNNGQRGGNFNLYANNLPQPPGNARTFAIVEAVFDLRYADGPPQPAIFHPIEDFDGVWVGIQEFPDSRVRVSRVGERLRVDFDPDTFRRFAHPEFFTADRTPININGWSSSNRNTGVNRTYNIDLDNQGRVILWFYPSIKTATIPFRARNIVLPERPQSDGVDLVIRLGEDPANANDPAQPDPAQPPNELNIVVPNKPDAG